MPRPRHPAAAAGCINFLTSPFGRGREHLASGWRECASASGRSVYCFDLDGSYFQTSLPPQPAAIRPRRIVGRCDARYRAGAVCDAAGGETARAGRIFGHRPGLDRRQRAADRLVRSARSLACAVRLAAISQRAGADLAVPRLRRAVGPAARQQGRALHFLQRQGRLVHRPHRLPGQRDDRARRCRGRADARARRQADHHTRLVRFRIDRA